MHFSLSELSLGSNLDYLIHSTNVLQALLCDRLYLQILWGAPTPRMENSGTDSNSLASSPLFWTVNSRPFHVDAECFVKMRFGNCPQWCEFPPVRGMEVMPSKAMFIITSVINLENLIKSIP